MATGTGRYAKGGSSGRKARVAGKWADDWFDPIPLDGEPAEIDVSVAHIARVYNYWLGGKDNISQEVRADFRNHV